MSKEEKKCSKNDCECEEKKECKNHSNEEHHHGRCKELEAKIELLEKGETLVEETRKFDSETGTTIFMRKKEPNKDYRYFPEPDIPYLYLDDETLKKEM